MEGRMGIYDSVKKWMDIIGVNVGIGTGISLKDFAARPYLKISFVKCSMVDFGAIVTTLNELGLAAGLNISKKKDKAKIWIDAGAVTDFDKLEDLKIPKLGFFAGFRLTF
jgi:hypothetical protein